MLNGGDTPTMRPPSIMVYHTKRTNAKWLDLAAFCQSAFPASRNQINRIHYLAPRVDARVEKTSGDLTGPLRNAGILFKMTRRATKSQGLCGHLGNVGEYNGRRPGDEPCCTFWRSCGRR